MERKPAFLKGKKWSIMPFMGIPGQLTYAISLLPDQEAAARIRTAVQELARNSGNNFMVEHAVPPHLTLGVFHAQETDLALLQKLFKEFSERARGVLQKDFCLDFFGADKFLDKVIFLSLGSAQEARKKNPALFGLNAALHQIFLERFEPGDNRNYIPANWHPHIALSVKMNATQFKKGFDFAKNLCLPKRAAAASLSLALCKPYKEIERVELY